LLLRGDIVLHRCVIIAVLWVGFGGAGLVGWSFGFVAKEMVGVEGANEHGAATAAMLKVGGRFVIRVGAGCSPCGFGPWDRSGGVRGEGIELGLSPKRGLRGRGAKLLGGFVNICVAQYHVGPVRELDERGQLAALEGTMPGISKEARHSRAAVAAKERYAHIRVGIQEPVVGMRWLRKRGADGDGVIVGRGIVAAHVGVEVARAVHRQRGRGDGGR
jgi:hypothetical protein